MSGAGPGAADLLTLRAVRLLEEADVVLYPGTYVDAVLDHCRPDAEIFDTAELSLDEFLAQSPELRTHDAAREAKFGATFAVRGYYVRA